MAVAREVRELKCRLQRALECTQEQMLQVERHKEQVLANRGSHLNDLQIAQRLKDNEIAMLKRHHETERAGLHRRLEEAKRRSIVSSAENKNNEPLDFASSKSRYDYIRRQSKMLKDFMDNSWPGGSTIETSLYVLTFFFDHHLGVASRKKRKKEIPYNEGM